MGSSRTMTTETGDQSKPNAANIVPTSRPVPNANPKSISRVYADFNSHMPSEYWDYEALEIDWKGQEKYEILERVGMGKYSEVFSGIDRETNQICIIKVLKPVRSKKIKREVKILQNLQKGPNIVQLLDLVIEPESRTPSFIFECINSVSHKKYIPEMQEYDVKYYIFQLLRALDFAHSHGIMHRDVKPHNVIYDPATRAIRLIDWGLAEFYHPGVSYNVRVASRYYKGPELLVDFMEYDYSLDLWSLGCILAGIIFQKDPFFRGDDNADQLVKIVNILGMEEFNDYVHKYSIKLPKEVNSALRNNRSRRISWQKLADKRPLATPQAIDLVDKLLKYDHQERLTAAEAMQHPFFDEVRHILRVES